MQHDQAAPPALQHRPARRQVVPLHLRRQNVRRAAVSAHRAAPRRQAQGLRLFRSVRVVRRGQRDARRAVAGLSGALLPRQHLPQPHPALPAVSDQALHGALRRADRAGRLCAAARADAGVFGRAQRRHPGSAQGGDGGRLGTAGIRAGGGDPRPAEGAGAHHLAPGHQRQHRRRCRRDRARSGRRAGLRPGVLLPGGP